MDTLFAGADALEHAVDLVTAPTPTQLDITDILARIRAASSEETTQTFTSEFATIAVEKKDGIHSPSSRREAGAAHPHRCEAARHAYERRWASW